MAEKTVSENFRYYSNLHLTINYREQDACRVLPLLGDALLRFSLEITVTHLGFFVVVIVCLFFCFSRFSDVKALFANLSKKSYKETLIKVIIINKLRVKINHPSLHLKVPTVPDVSLSLALNSCLRPWGIHN